MYSVVHNNNIITIV